MGCLGHGGAQNKTVIANGSVIALHKIKYVIAAGVHRIVVAFLGKIVTLLLVG